MKTRVPWQTCTLGDVERIEVMSNLATISIPLHRKYCPFGELEKPSRLSLLQPIAHDSWFFAVNWYGNGHSHLQEIFHESTVVKEGSKMAEVPWIPAGYPIDETSINRFVYSTCPKSPAPLRENKKQPSSYEMCLFFSPCSLWGSNSQLLKLSFNSSNCVKTSKPSFWVSRG